MRRSVHRIGDKNTAGGAATQPRRRVLSRGRPLAKFRSKVTPHPCCGVPGCNSHCVAKIGGRARTTLAEGKPVHVTGDGDTCGHRRAMGDLRVLVVRD